ncbi:MAG: hypothetical protein HOO06_01585 [Bdellovibrionaceae bacterium]|jgi:two-component system, NtrC family, sensor histidine kinase PilS|nr:hypothetical protein [Pseudobdellovibrionaceae bacterium]
MSNVDFLTQENYKTESLGADERIDRLIVIQAVRVIFLVFLLMMIVSYQSFQVEFLNPNVWVPVYLFLAVSFLINAIFLVYFESLSKYWVMSAAVFAYDALLYTSLIYYTGANQSVFLFLYLVNIILCGLVYQRKGAITLSLWTSILFSFLLIMGPNTKGQNLFFAVVLNNISFFTVAFLSGKLSELIAFMGHQLEARNKEIDELQDFSKIIIENIGTGLLTLSRDFKISYCNDAALKIFESDLKIDDHIDNHFNNISSLILEGQGSSRLFEYSINDKMKGKQVLEFSVSPIMDTNENSEVRGFILLFQDKTEIKRLENEIRQNDKLAAVGQLAAGIAHEIRNPLASISGSVQLILDDAKDQSESNQKLLKIMDKEINRLNELITEFLDFVIPDFQANDVIEINELIEDTLKVISLNNTIRDDIVYDLELNSRQIIMGNKNKLKQAVLNIIINAHQAMEKSKHPVLKIKTIDNGASIKLLIIDNGVGMDDKMMKRVFEPFHTTKPKGTGLGMAVTHKIIEAHEAKIFIDSELNVGTTITIEFTGAVLDGEENKVKKIA